MKNIQDPRQKKKVKYPINEVVGMVLFASLGNANEWTEIEVFCNLYLGTTKNSIKTLFYAFCLMVQNESLLFGP